MGYGRFSARPGIAVNLDDFYAGRLDFQQLMAAQAVPRDPRFLLPRAYQSPRAARILLKFAF